MASSTGIAADPMPTQAPGAPVDDGSRGERPDAPRPTEGGGRADARRASPTRPANWRVRTKLIAILTIPVIAIIVNALIDASTVLTSTRDINRVSHLIAVDRSALTLAYDLQKERTYTADFVAHRVDNRGQQPDLSRVTPIVATVDSDYRAYDSVAGSKRGSFTAQVNETLDSVTQRMSNFPAKRQAIRAFNDPTSVMQAYDAVIQPLIDLVGLIPQGNDDRSLSSSVQAAQHLATATELLAQQQAQVNVYLVGAQVSSSPLPFTPDDSRAVLSLDAQRRNELDQFAVAATPAQNQLYNTNLDPRANKDYGNNQTLTAAVINSQVGQALDTGVIDEEKWLKSADETLKTSNLVISGLLDQVNSRVGTLRGSIQRQALFSALFTVLILAGALVITLVVAQSLIRPLFALRTAALDIAERRLPDAVRRLRDSSDQVIDDDVETVGIETDEEIGEVARAFDQVHREAVRLASEQAVLRNNVNAMFVNLSRRSQGLVERQLRLIDDLENREQDPDQLANLFKLDHLATRMRRNNESLLVLAGTDTARRWTHPVPLNEVVLAAISEVEQYTRVKQTTAAPVSIAGNGVSDVVHLIAELLENATSYSPPATDVVVTSHSLGPGAGAMIEIVDQGIGMPAKELERVNERLANPPVVDVSVSRTMGLFAVGRLASRHGIRVQLRESPSRGITAVIRLPAKLVTGDGNTLGTGPGAARPSLGKSDSGTRPAGQGLAAAFGGPAALSGGAARPELSAGPSAPMTGPARQPAAFGGAGQLGGPQPGSAEDRGGPHQFDDPDAPERPGSSPGSLPAVDAGRFGPPPLAIGPGQGYGDQQDRAPEHTGPGPVGRAHTGPVPIGSRHTGPVHTGPHSTAMPMPEPRYTEQDTQRFGRESLPGQPTGRQRGGYQGDYGGAEYGDAPAGPVDRRDERADWTGEFPVQRPGMARSGDYGPNGRPGDEEADHHDDRDPAQTGPQENVFARPATRPEPVVDVSPRWDERTDPSTGGLRRPSGEDTGEFYVGEGEDVDTTPIFDSVSAWFQRRSPADEQRRGQAGPGPVVETTTGALSPPRGVAGAQPIGPGTGHGAGAGTGVAVGNGGYQPPAGPVPMRPAARVDAGLGSGAGAGHGAGGGNGYRPAAAYDAPSGPRAGYDAPSGPRAGYDVPSGPRAGYDTPSGPRPAVGDAPSGPRPAAASAQPLPTRNAGAGWESAGDAGWRAAEALRGQGTAETHTTKAGLPVRVPKQHLVPGSAEPVNNRKPPERPVDGTTRSPEAVGGRLASFYQGVRQGRTTGAEMRSARRDGQEDR
jgi:signal transduction histidine kinase